MFQKIDNKKLEMKEVIKGTKVFMSTTDQIEEFLNGFKINEEKQLGK